MPKVVHKTANICYVIWPLGEQGSAQYRDVRGAEIRSDVLD